MKVLFVTPECAPLAKTGGLGDVGAALPAALRALGHDVHVLLPGYREVLDRMSEADFAKEGTHSEHGAYSVDRWLEIYADHAHNHAAQIRRARAAAR